MATYLNYPYDPELFNHTWQNEPDPTLTAILRSGAMTESQTIRDLISVGSSYYTLPFLKDITGTPANYDGNTDIPTTSPEGDAQSGIVYGRTQGWTGKDFVFDFNGPDPMQQIASRVGSFWNKYRQAMIVRILTAIFGITGDADWTKHTEDLTLKTAGTISDANKVSEATFNNAAQKAVGDNSRIFTLAIMHSAVANRLANLQLLKYWLYNDANGMQRQMNMGDINGMTAIIDDGVPASANAQDASATDYTSYLLGAGALLTAPARLDRPSDVEYDPKTNGGQETLYTRIRETIHPNGFTFQTGTGMTSIPASPTDAQLGNSNYWKRKMNAKSVPIARVITNG